MKYPRSFLLGLGVLQLNAADVCNYLCNYLYYLFMYDMGFHILIE